MAQSKLYIKNGRLMRFYVWASIVINIISLTDMLLAAKSISPIFLTLLLKADVMLNAGKTFAIITLAVLLVFELIGNILLVWFYHHFQPHWKRVALAFSFVFGVVVIVLLAIMILLAMAFGNRPPGARLGYSNTPPGIHKAHAF